MGIIKKYTAGKRDGVITVEATIAFTTFAILMLTILFIIRMVYVYELVQHEINQAAKEIASYSYIYGVTVMGVDDTIQKNSNAAAEDFNQKAGNIVDGIDGIISVGESAYDTVDSATDMDLDGVIQNAQATGQSYKDLKEQFPDAIESVQSIISNPKRFLKSIGSIFAGNALSDAKAFFGGEIVRAMMSSYLSDMNNSGGNSYSPSDRLEKLGVVGGLGGIDFSQSRFNETVDGQEHSIDIVACYKVKPISPIQIYKEVGFMNRVTVKMWVGN